MIDIVACWLRPLPRAVRCALAPALIVAVCTIPAASAGPSTERVRGFFCNEKTDQIGFLALKARGESEEMAANAVNKNLGKFSCAYYLPATAIHTGEQTVIESGLVFKLQSYLFLPERIERWSGAALGSLQQTGARDVNI
jgi:hypothetical protein